MTLTWTIQDDHGTLPLATDMRKVMDQPLFQTRLRFDVLIAKYKFLLCDVVLPLCCRLMVCHLAEFFSTYWSLLPTIGPFVSSWSFFVNEGLGADLSQFRGFLSRTVCSMGRVLLCDVGDGDDATYAALYTGGCGIGLLEVMDYGEVYEKLLRSTMPTDSPNLCLWVTWAGDEGKIY